MMMMYDDVDAYIEDRFSYDVDFFCTVYLLTKCNWFDDDELNDDIEIMILWNLTHIYIL